MHSEILVFLRHAFVLPRCIWTGEHATIVLNNMLQLRPLPDGPSKTIDHHHGLSKLVAKLPINEAQSPTHQGRFIIQAQRALQYVGNSQLYAQEPGT